MSCVIRFVKWIRVCLRFISRVKGAQILLYSCFERKKGRATVNDDWQQPSSMYIREM